MFRVFSPFCVVLVLSYHGLLRCSRCTHQLILLLFPDLHVHLPKKKNAKTATTFLPLKYPQNRLWVRSFHRPPLSVQRERSPVYRSAHSEHCSPASLQRDHRECYPPAAASASFSCSITSTASCSCSVSSSTCSSRSSTLSDCFLSWTNGAANAKGVREGVGARRTMALRSMAAEMGSVVGRGSFSDLVLR
ncbi:hypothetical protein DFH07DRAFT_354310 [Mycena maculata]|uniref:Secreted protein n=1 Tax=Mycena maculata TaxID=230809 RepID=A0AAD7HAZ4_9AGAR|nr:hypothetical protein DFH07DRAFT_354310 [Mycena maculata]